MNVRDRASETIEASVADRLGDVRSPDGGMVRKVRDRSRHAKDAMIGPRREVEPAHGTAKEAIGRGVRLAELLGISRTEASVQHALSLALTGGRALDSRPHGVAVLGIRAVTHHVGPGARDFDLQIDAVEQRSRDAIPVTHDLLRRAFAFAARM